MPINQGLLIAAPMLQDSFVDKLGIPMANGTVTCYHDDSRTTLKNWYYQTGTPGLYTFLPLPNPLTLSAAGTICDINGVDTIPFFYPYLESDESIIDKYYITIVNEFGTNQITRANFPYNVAEAGAVTTVTQFSNLIINNGFWRNVLPNTVNSAPPQSIILSTGGASTFLIPNINGNFAAIVSPSQHDGFSTPDCQFIKNNLTANDAMAFVAFPLESQLLINGTNTPEYYVVFNCTQAGTNEIQKCFQFPISLHINNLANLNYTVSIQASSSSSSTIELRLLQYTGAGTLSPTPTVIALSPITLTPTFNKYVLTDIFPSAAGLTLGVGNDDAFYLQVSMPMNTLCNVNFTKPSLYLTNNVVPTVDYQSYDQVNAIISSPRSGDVRLSLNLIGVPYTIGPSFGSFGWVYANDGTIGSTASAATSRANNDTFILYYNLWTNVLNAWAPVSGGRGASAIADFAANKTIGLPKQLSRLIGEAGAGAGLTAHALAESTNTGFAAGATILGSVYYDVYYKL